MSVSRSEGFSRTGYLLPVGGPGLSPEGLGGPYLDGFYTIFGDFNSFLIDVYGFLIDFGLILFETYVFYVENQSG